MCHGPHMAVRKPDAEVGPLGVWAYNTSRSLDLSAEQVAHRVGVSGPYVRKIEGGSQRRPSRALVEAMDNYFREVAAERNRTVAGPPGDWAIRRSPPASDQAALVAAINDLVSVLRPIAEQAQDREARLRAIEAELRSLRERPTGAALPGRSAPQARAG